MNHLSETVLHDLADDGCCSQQRHDHSRQQPIASGHVLFRFLQARHRIAGAFNLLDSLLR